MIDARLLGHNHLISNKREWNNCFMKKEPKEKKKVGLADLILQERPEDNLMAAKPIKTLECIIQ